MVNNRKGFTLAELVVGIVVMIITLSAATVSINVSNASPKQEAEKIAGYFVKLTEKADRIKADFTAEIYSDKISVTWKDKAGNEIGSEELSLNYDFKYTPHFDEKKISNTAINKWTYCSGDNVKILAAEKLSGSYKIAAGTVNYNYNKDGHRYLTIGAINGPTCYVVLTAIDIAK